MYGKTPKGARMPLEYNPANIPDGMIRNVAYYRSTPEHTAVVILTDAQARRAADGEGLDVVLPDLINAEFYKLTVAHFASCPAARIARAAQRGEIPGVIPMKRAKAKR